MSEASPQSEAPVRPGDVLAGKYRVARVLGMGGMGVVVAAHHLQLDEPVALKFLLPAAAANDSIRGRFLREGQAAVKIRSEHVARTLDVGTLETGAPYLVMELLEGTDLSDKLARTGPLPLPLAIEYLLQASHAIGVAHGLGIVHRDIKPANLFLTTRPDGSECIKVLDFGISKIQGAEGFDMTSTGAVLGSPYYMSPEQFMSSKNVDPRADIWSLGAVFYELLMGRPPFGGDSIGELVAQVLQAPAPPLMRGDLPPALQGFMARALAKNPADRFGSIAELGAALAPFASDMSRTSLERLAGLGRSRDSALPASAPQPPSSISHGGLTPLPAVTPFDVGGKPSGATASAWGSAPTQAATKSRAPLFIALGASALTIAGLGIALGFGLNRSATVASPSIDVAPLPPPSAASPAPPPPQAKDVVSAVATVSAAPPEASSPPAETSADKSKSAPKTNQPAQRRPLEATPTKAKPSPAAPPPPPAAAAAPVMPDDRK